jgi:hypothetical protein
MAMAMLALNGGEDPLLPQARDSTDPEPRTEPELTWKDSEVTTFVHDNERFKLVLLVCPYRLR